MKAVGKTAAKQVARYKQELPGGFTSPRPRALQAARAGCRPCKPVRACVGTPCTRELVMPYATRHLPQALPAANHPSRPSWSLPRAPAYPTSCTQRIAPVAPSKAK